MEENTMNYNKKSIEDIEVAGKRVLCRCDFNVPTKEGKITSDKRIVAALPTIQYLIDKGAKVILCSHMGKPKGEWKPELSLKIVADRLRAGEGKRTGRCRALCATNIRGLDVGHTEIPDSLDASKRTCDLVEFGNVGSVKSRVELVYLSGHCCQTDTALDCRLRLDKLSVSRLSPPSACAAFRSMTICNEPRLSGITDSPYLPMPTYV